MKEMALAREDGTPPYEIGGPTAMPYSPRWECNVCGRRFGSLNGPFT